MAIFITSASRICSFRIVVSAREHDDSLLLNAALFKTPCLIALSTAPAARPLTTCAFGLGAALSDTDETTVTGVVGYEARGACSSLSCAALEKYPPEYFIVNCTSDSRVPALNVFSSMLKLFTVG